MNSKVIGITKSEIAAKTQLLKRTTVCLYPMNVKTAEPIGPKVFVGPRSRVNPGKVYK